MFQRYLKIEGGGLLIATPFLFFPFAFLPATIFSLLIVIWIWTKNWKAPAQMLPAIPLNGAMLIWVISILIGLLVSQTPDITIPKATGLIFGLTLWRFVVISICNYRQLGFALGLFILTGFAITIASLFVVQWYVKVPFFQNLISLFPPQLLHLPGSPALGVSPNQLAGTLTVFVPFAIIPFFSWRSQKKYRYLKIATFFGGAFLFFVLVLTQSRSGWIAAAASVIAIICLYIFILIYNRFRTFPLGRISIIALIPLLLAGTWWFSLPNVSNVMNSTIAELPRPNSYSLIFRQEVWSGGIQALEQSLLTGVGLGSFRQVFSDSFRVTIGPNFDIGHAHNFFLQTALDVGLPGLTAYMAILILAFYMGWEVVRESNTLKPLAIGLVAGIIGLNVFGLTDAITIGSKTHFVFWFAIGILAGIRQLSKLAVVDSSQ